MSRIIYAGVGSRETPERVCLLMQRIAAALARGGALLRSGGAGGADTAFEVGCDSVGGAKEIFLPWAGFNGNTSPLVSPPIEAYRIAQQTHPFWYRLKRGARALHARNVQQVLGPTPDTAFATGNLSHYVICYTRGGWGGGGTGQAIRIANRYKIPIYDLGIERIEKDFRRWLEGK